MKVLVILFVLFVLFGSCRKTENEIKSQKYYEEGQVLEKQGKYEDALGKYKEAIKSDYKNNPAHNRIGRLYPYIQKEKEDKKIQSN